MADYTAEQYKAAAKKAFAAGDMASAQELADKGMALAAVKPEQSFGAKLYENVIGSGEIDTPGERFGATIKDVGKSLGAGLARGTAGLAALPGDIGDLASGAATAGFNKLFGSELQAPQPSMLGSEPMQAGMSAITGGGSQYQPTTTAGEYAGTVGEFIPGAALFGGASPANIGKFALAPGVASEAAGQATEGTSIEPAARIAGALIAPTAIGQGQKIASALRHGTATREAVKGTQSIADLEAAAGKLYDEALRTGATATATETKAFANGARNMLLGEGVISPTGRVSSALPKIREAARTIAEYADTPMNPAQMKAVRKTLQIAAKSVDPNEARLGSKLIESFDDFTSNMTPTIKEANKLYTQAMRGKQIEQAVEVAGVNAGAFHGAGFENALRSQFRQMARKIAKGQMKGLSPDQVAAINKVAKGGSLENVARWIGKAAPTGVVSAGMGGGMPFLVGNAVGGPGVGAVAGLGTMGAGIMGRGAATAMQRQNADIASALMRGMKPVARQQTAPMSEDALKAALLAALSKGQQPK